MPRGGKITYTHASRGSPASTGRSVLGEAFTRFTDPANASPNIPLVKAKPNEPLFPGPKTTVTKKKKVTKRPGGGGGGGGGASLGIVRKKPSVVAQPQEEKVGWFKKFVRGGQKPNVKEFQRKAGLRARGKKPGVLHDYSSLKYFNSNDDN